MIMQQPQHIMAVSDVNRSLCYRIVAKYLVNREEICSRKNHDT